MRASGSQAYNMFCVNGILFNHESPRRGGAAGCAAGCAAGLESSFCPFHPFCCSTALRGRGALEQDGMEKTETQSGLTAIEHQGKSAN